MPSDTAPISSPDAGTLLVVGELLIDIVTTADGDTSEHVGGSPANVAIGLARLEHPVVLATAIGDDERGRTCAEHVRAAGVRVDPASVTDTPTSTAAAALDEQGAASYTFDLHWDLPTVSLPADTVHVHTGSIATTLDPGQRQVTDVLTRARPVATISYDPNMRPSIMGDHDQVRPRVEELVALSDVVKCSDEDLEVLYPDDDLEGILDRWADLGAPLTVITRGGDGVLWRCPDGQLGRAAAADATVADTVGAGDSFMAGLVSGLVDAGLLGGPAARAALAEATADQVRPAIDRALATSGITVTHTGAYAPTRSELSTS